MTWDSLYVTVALAVASLILLLTFLMIRLWLESRISHAPAVVPTWSAPVPPGSLVWVAEPVVRGGLAHELATDVETACGIGTRAGDRTTGRAMYAQTAVVAWGACWCQGCWPALAGADALRPRGAHRAGSQSRRDPR
jgi:hypothetical protein